MFAIAQLPSPLDLNCAHDHLTRLSARFARYPLEYLSQSLTPSSTTFYCHQLESIHVLRDGRQTERRRNSSNPNGSLVI